MLAGLAARRLRGSRLALLAGVLVAVALLGALACALLGVYGVWADSGFKPDCIG